MGGLLTVYADNTKGLTLQGILLRLNVVLLHEPMWRSFQPLISTLLELLCLALDLSCLLSQSAWLNIGQLQNTSVLLAGWGKKNTNNSLESVAGQSILGNALVCFLRVKSG